MANDNSYFSYERTDIAPLLPAFAERVLDVGCGAGATIGWLKREGRCGYAVGIEYVPEAAESAKAIADAVICGDAERADLGDQKFDLILLLDVLEHLVDPWAFLKRLQDHHMRPNALVIASIPNVRNYRVLKSLVFKGEFEYRSDGILDRTHLRFFTRKSALKLLGAGQLRIESTTDLLASKKTYRQINRLLGGALSDFLAYQYLIAARYAGT